MLNIGSMKMVIYATKKAIDFPKTESIECSRLSREASMTIS